MSVLALSQRRLNARGQLARARASAGTLWVAVTVLTLTALTGSVAFVGGDARWLAAMGRIVNDSGIPRGVPFASAATGHWHNPIVLSELILYWLEHAFGDAGLAAAQTLATAIGLAFLARTMRRRGARAGAVCGALASVVIGAATSFAIVRVQLFSLALFPLLLALIYADVRTRSARIWLVLPVVALWSNLHGAVLVGLLVLYAYLLLERVRVRAGADGLAAPSRRLETAAIGLLAPVALSLTSAGVHTFAYYQGVLGNLAARRGAGMWAPLGTGTFDLVTIAVALSMFGLWLAARRRLRAWEWLTAIVLAIATVKASRDGIWLVMYLSVPGAAALSSLGRRVGSSVPTATESGTRRRDWIGLLPVAAVLALLLLTVDLIHWSATAASGTPAAVTRAVALADGTPILADTVPGEEVALAGGRIWAGNPIDAFSHAVQAAFLDFDQGLPSGSAALGLPQIRVAVVTASSGADRLLAHDSRYRLSFTDGGYSVYLRR